MKFAIITHVPHIKQSDRYFAYAPYVREMNIWSKHVDQLIVVAPQISGKKSPIEECYEHDDIDFKKIRSFDVLSVGGVLKTVLTVPAIILAIFRAMQKADHIHLRCPGNIGLLACIVQIAFPSKAKTAKYAGNWDPASKQPWSYRLQKWILNNTFLTKNMQVLVYGQWENQSENVKPFFTATYAEGDKVPVTGKKMDGKIRFLFVGTLSEGKRPLYTVRLAEQLYKNGYDVQLDLYGDGKLREELENYVNQNNLPEEVISLKGNCSADEVMEAYQQSHFLILPSKSEGWPKAVAEAMFWGCVPVATTVSCIPQMLDYGKRGILLEMDLETDTQKMIDIWNDLGIFEQMSQYAVQWSRQYTVDLFEQEITKLLQ